MYDQAPVKAALPRADVWGANVVPNFNRLRNDHRSDFLRLTQGDTHLIQSGAVDAIVTSALDFVSYPYQQAKWEAKTAGMTAEAIDQMVADEVGNLAFGIQEALQGHTAILHSHNPENELIVAGVAIADLARASFITRAASTEPIVGVERLVAEGFSAFEKIARDKGVSMTDLIQRELHYRNLLTVTRQRYIAQQGSDAGRMAREEFDRKIEEFGLKI